MRQIVLDTETTGLEPRDGHRVIEIGAVELIDRRLTGRHFHQYLNPERDIEDGALEVHGITRDFLQDKPVFADVAQEFLDFIEGTELLIHNAPFDIGFLDMELGLINNPLRIENHAQVLDTLELARDLHPGQRNSLDALCKRYEVDNSSRNLHGALLDSEILADVYLAMTGGQSDLALGFEFGPVREGGGVELQIEDRPALQILLPTDEEKTLHEARLQAIKKKSGHCLWLEL
ncbi:MAG: DNA polymerase III subunit epsilon [Lysobacterales bacterium]